MDTFLLRHGGSKTISQGLRIHRNSLPDCFFSSSAYSRDSYAEEEGFEHYMFSTRCGHFSSAFASKTVSHQLRIPKQCPTLFASLFATLTAEEEGFETYSFSTHSGYFCSAFASKTISERLRIHRNSLPDCFFSSSANKICVLANAILYWRKRRDSNPRSGLPDAGFRNRCTKPLCDSSKFDGSFICLYKLAFFPKIR